MTDDGCRCRNCGSLHPDEIDAVAEIERLRALVQLDGEQHATHVRALEAQHELRHKHYCAEIERLCAERDELLGEFQRIVDCGDKMTNDSRGVSVWAIARAAIAKAEGGK